MKNDFPFLLLLAAFAFLSGCARTDAPETVEWTVMDTTAKIVCRDKKDLSVAKDVKKVFADVEALLNAHDPSSELSNLQTLPDEEILEKCTPWTRPCYEAAFRFRDVSGGVFNPRWRGEGTMDLGAIAKGFAVDLACEKAAGRDMLVDLGGNMKACAGKWRVGIYGSSRTIVLGAGESCATSGEYFRGRHIKDGRDGRDAANGGVSVTVVHSASAMAADALGTILWITKEKDAAGYDGGAKEVVWLE